MPSVRPPFGLERGDRLYAYKSSGSWVRFLATDFVLGVRCIISMSLFCRIGYGGKEMNAKVMLAL
jgi:hypothetical protein